MSFIEPFLDVNQPDVFLAEGESARATLAKTKLPTKKDEAWKFFSLKNLFAREFGTTSSNTATADLPVIAECADFFIVVRNGVIDWAASNLERLESGLVVKAYGELTDEDREKIPNDADPFTADFFDLVNRSIRKDALVIMTPSNSENVGPIQIIYVQEGEDIAIAPTTEIVVLGGILTFVETWVGEGAYFSTNRTNVTLRPNARANHFRVQRESDDAVHIARVAVSVAEGAHYDSVSVTFGAKSSRTDMHVTHAGPNGFARIDGLAVLKDGQQSDTHSVVDNQFPHCNSHQLHKCVVDDDAHAIFNGKIFVQEDAQKVDAYQLNRNLLLSKKAKVNTKPQLEIFADDVRCTHGATIGQLDDEQLFYLMSRGTKLEDARAMLTYAFAAEVIDHISIDSLKQDLEDEALRRTTRTP